MKALISLHRVFAVLVLWWWPLHLTVSGALFDPSGRVLQAEYASRAVMSKGLPICAIKASDGLILASYSPNLKNTLIEQLPQKVFFIDNHIAIAVCGMLFDAVQIVDFAKRRNAIYKDMYNSAIPVNTLCEDLSSLLNTLTIESKYRPLGVGLIVCGWDNNSVPQISTLTCDGSRLSGWNAVAMGKGSKEIMKSLADIVNKQHNIHESKKISRHSASDLDESGNNEGIEGIWPLFRSRILRKYFTGIRSLEDVEGINNDNNHVDSGNVVDNEVNCEVIIKFM